MPIKKTFAALAMVGVVCLSGVHQAVAACNPCSLPMTASIAFDSALGIVKNADINFDTVKAATADTYTISTSGVVSALGGASHLLGQNGATAGSITISGSATETISISVGGYTASNGDTPSAATCAYNGGGSGSCTIAGAAAPGAGKTLLLGVTVTTTVAGSTVNTTATPSFTVTVTYP